MNEEQIRKNAIDFIIAKQNKSTEEILKAVAKVKSDYHELCNLKDMRIAELEEKISVLLSCKNCPENKGGYICEKEYENKCLAQKIEYIKELQKENAELKLKLDALEGETPWKDIKDKSEVIGKLTIAKEIIKKLKALYLYPVVTKDDVKRQDEILNEAEQFLKDNEVKK